MIPMQTLQERAEQALNIVLAPLGINLGHYMPTRKVAAIEAMILVLARRAGRRTVRARVRKRVLGYRHGNPEDRMTTPSDIMTAAESVHENIIQDGPESSINHIAEALKAERDGQWQTMDTAPTNGTEILGASTNNYDCEIVWFGSCETLELTDRENEDIDEDTFWFESWWCNTVRGAIRLEGEEAPTHWRPLPPPPTDRGNIK